MSIKKSRSELLRFAEARIGEFPESVAAASGALMRLLEQIVVDGQPTPQPSPALPEGAVAEWLVGGDFVGLFVDAEMWEMWCTTSDGLDVDIASGAIGDSMPDEAVATAREILGWMGQNVRFDIV